jgi:hypothetical protein
MSLRNSDRMAWPSWVRGSVLLAAALADGCATTPRVRPPDVPAALRPPAAEQPFLEARGAGVQIYECAAKANQPTVYEWTFRAPEASLLDPSGHAVGRHYAGPTWESTDGSSVVGDVRARDPGPTATAIPWLLLAAKSTTGLGVFSKTTSIQRVQTVGGIAPSDPCNAGTAQKIARVPYTATYYFYRALP